MLNLTMFAAESSLPINPWLALAIIALGLGCVSILMLVVNRYKICPSNQVMVISGKVRGGSASECIHGGAAFVWPIVQRYDYLSLEPIQIEIPLKGALSMENIRVNVPSIFTVAIGTDREVMGNASHRLLHLTVDEIKQQAGDIIFGQLRQVIASMRIEEINRDRDSFLENIQKSLEPELKKIGLVLLNVNITDITDESGYIEAIGRKAASQAVQQAAVDVAQQEKMGQIGVAEAERERAIQVANAQKEREIGTRVAMRDQMVNLANLEKEQKYGEEKAAYERDALIKQAQREQAVRIAELDKEQRVGEQKAAFEKEAQIKNNEREMRIAVADANAKAVSGENEAKAEIANSMASLKVKEAEAYQLGETRKREAEAAVLEAQNRAMAKAALAEAEKIEAERRAVLEAPAKAEKAKTIIEAEAAAEKQRIEAEGEASAIFAKLDAEARGQYEILAKKGDGLQRIIDACGGAQQAFQLLMLEHLDKLAETAAQAISNIKFDKVIVWENGNGSTNGTGVGNTAQFLQSMARTMPPMMQILKDIGGVELPDYIAKLTPEGQRQENHRPETSSPEQAREQARAEAPLPPKG
ncbi:MAG: flotillin family protein [Gemmataceae bacterium]